MIYDFRNCMTNERNGTYGGLAGDKEGITFQGENWIIKYPKSTKGMRGELISYMTSPLSEYIGSHIYKILGYDVHETLLGIRNNKIVVACKDFCKNEGALREIRTLKNIYNENLSKVVEESFLPSSVSHTVDIDELMLHFKYNPILSNRPDIIERFWDCVVVDIFINNNDRNNGNWGLLFEDKKYRLAPIFDNGAAFSNKFSEERIKNLLYDENRMRDSSLKTNTIYSSGETVLTAEKMLKIDDKNLESALNKNVPLLKAKMQEIRTFIDEIPKSYQNIEVCSKERKEFYIKGMELRLNEIIEPAFRFRSRERNNSCERER